MRPADIFDYWGIRNRLLKLRNSGDASNHLPGRWRDRTMIHERPNGFGVEYREGRFNLIGNQDPTRGDNGRQSAIGRELCIIFWRRRELRGRIAKPSHGYIIFDGKGATLRMGHSAAKYHKQRDDVDEAKLREPWKGPESVAGHKIPFGIGRRCEGDLEDNF
jgi:hypothetical protein